MVFSNSFSPEIAEQYPAILERVEEILLDLVTSGQVNV